MLAVNEHPTFTNLGKKCIIYLSRVHNSASPKYPLTRDMVQMDTRQEQRQGLGKDNLTDKDKSKGITWQKQKRRPRQWQEQQRELPAHADTDHADLCRTRNDVCADRYGISGVTAPP